MDAVACDRHRAGWLVGFEVLAFVDARRALPMKTYNGFLGLRVITKSENEAAISMKVDCGGAADLFKG
jgi:hypothetical protein